MIPPTSFAFTLKTWIDHLSHVEQVGHCTGVDADGELGMLRRLGPFPPLEKLCSMVKHLSIYEIVHAEVFTEIVFGPSGPQHQLDSSL